MSDTFTLTISPVESPGQAPAHESTHASVPLAVAKLGSILREAGRGDRAVPRDPEWSRHRPVYNLIDIHGDTVGTAVVEHD